MQATNFVFREFEGLKTVLECGYWLMNEEYCNEKKKIQNKSTYCLVGITACEVAVSVTVVHFVALHEFLSLFCVCFFEVRNLSEASMECQSPQEQVCSPFFKPLLVLVF